MRFDGAEVPKTLDGSIVGMISPPATPIDECFKNVRLVDFI
jgi:hypothetical protein